MTCSLIMVFTHGYQYPRKNKVNDVARLRSFYERISAYTDDDIKRIIDDGDDVVQLLRYAVAFGISEKFIGMIRLVVSKDDSKYSNIINTPVFSCYGISTVAGHGGYAALPMVSASAAVSSATSVSGGTSGGTSGGSAGGGGGMGAF